MLFSSYQYFLALFSPARSAPSTVVHLGYAGYRGNQSNPSTVAYLGIPYAEPPLRELRFRAPHPLNTSRIAELAGGQVLDATEYPDFCIQGTTGFNDAGGAGTEDCLKINVYTPSNATQTSHLPVLVYFHGGGYTYGNPAAWPFDHWIQQSPNVVIVAPYYRLDSFGFLSHPEFVDSDLADLNVGLLDQVRALKWTQQYISAFGGDPSRVTINGHSAGAGSVQLHLVANEEPLFSAAIAQSAFRAPLALPEQTLRLFDYYASHAGCGTGNVEEQMVCLRNSSVSALALAQDLAYYDLTGYNTFRPVVDGSIITDFPTRSILRGEVARVPLIVGAASDEGMPIVSTLEETLQALWPSLTEFDLKGFMSVYSPSQFESKMARLRASTGESLNRCAPDVLGSALSVVNNVWMYRYNQLDPSSSSKYVEHGAENWMMFRGSKLGINGSVTFASQSSEELAFSSEIIAYWLSFVRSLDPNTHKLARSPHWGRYTLNNRTRLVLQQNTENTPDRSGNEMEMVLAEESIRCAFIMGKVDHQQN